MKKIVLFTLIIFQTIILFGQKITSDRVPAPVKASLKSKYPTAAKVNWQMANAGEYKASFMMKKMPRSAFFAPDGTWRQTEIMVKINELPQNIRRNVSKQFVGYKLRNAYKIEKREGASVYKVLILKGTKMMNVVYAVTGEMLSKGVDN
jgi:hypothetical protein